MGGPSPAIPERSGGAAIVPVLLAAALCALSLAVHASRHYAGICRSDDYEYASIARNIARGEGAVTQHLYPIDLMLWNGALPHPDFMHPPGFAYAIAASFRLFGVRDVAAVLPSMVCFVLLGAAVYQLGRRLFGAVVAWYAVLLVALHPLLLDYAVQALSEVPATFLVTAGLAVLVSSTGIAGAFVAGMVWGAGQLVRENVVLMMPGVLVLTVLLPRTGLGSPPARRITAVVAGFAIAVALLVIRSLIYAGQPWTSYGAYSAQAFTSVYPHLDILRHTAAGSLGEFVAIHPGAFVAKTLKNLAASPIIVARALGPGIGLGLAAVIIAGARPPEARDRRLAAFSIGAIVMTAVNALALSMFVMIVRHHLVLVPCFALIAGVGVHRLIQGARFATGWERRLAMALLAALAIAWVGPYLAAISGDTGREARRGLQAFVAEHTENDAVVASDFPEAALWLADRNAATLPVTTASFAAMTGRIAIDYVLLTSIRTPGWDASWQRVWSEKAALPGFARAASFDDGRTSAVLLRRE